MAVNEAKPAIQSREPFLTPQQVADALQVSRAWVYDHARGRRRPVLRALRVGGIVRISRQDLDRFIEEWCK